MKYILSISLLALVISLKAQSFPKVDKSPMDAAYYPPRAALRAFLKTDEEKKVNQPKIRVTYSRPKKNGREVFGGLLKFGELWRVGANESTEILFIESATLGNTKIKKGRYTLYAIPDKNDWEIMISSDTDGWGQYSFDPDASTIARIKVPTEKTTETIESLSIVFEKSNERAIMIIGWDNTMVKVPFSF